jgi:hypothetical protein
MDDAATRFEEIRRLEREIALYEERLDVLDVDEESSLTGLVADLERRLEECRSELAKLTGGRNGR